MSSPTFSDISQHNTDMLEEQYYEMQWQYEEKQWLLVYLEEAMETYCVEHTAQKARREVEAKAREEAEK